MNLADHAKKFGTLYLAGAILVGCVIVALAILLRPSKSGGGKETDERVAVEHEKGHKEDLENGDLKKGKRTPEEPKKAAECKDLGNDPDKVQLWEGGPYWATKNIGAGKPWDHGYYFWWGDTVGYKNEDGAWVASDGSSKVFEFKKENTPTFDKDPATLQRGGWITAEGVLAPKHDAAQVQWGGEWRMPTWQELDSLCKKCDWAWTKKNGVNGYVVRGRGDYASVSIFLPCAGIGNGTSLDVAGLHGFYWSSVPYSDDRNSLSGILYFGSSDHSSEFDDRGNGLSVRPVQGVAKLSKQANPDGGKAADESVALDYNNDHKKAHNEGRKKIHAEDLGNNPDKVQLWGGGPYWADRNIGAEKPWEYGYYFWWGDTVGYMRQDGAWVASDGSSKGFEFKKENTPTFDKGLATLQREVWITAWGVLAPKHDAAQVQWGGRWRMPTKQELDDLSEKCDWTWTTTNGVNGYVVRGRGDYASASVFLPCAGVGAGTSLNVAGSRGSYWSSVPYSRSSYGDFSWSLDFDSGGHHVYYYFDRNPGYTIRPVQGVTKLSKQAESDGGKAADERVALEHVKDHMKDDNEDLKKGKRNPEEPKKAAESKDLEKAPDKVQLWEGGPYWATKNIGAEKPWECGYYFWWGDAVGYKFENGAWVASDGSSKGFEFSKENTPTCGKDRATLQREGWITADGVLAPKHDAAQVQWGGEWRMPTEQEMADLCKKCDWTWTTTNGVNGYVVRGRGDYASASIFLPYAGSGYGASLNYAGSYGNYWSSVPSSYNDISWYLRSCSSYHDTYYYYRYSGYPVRPVQGSTK